jgi:hypothetical protein
MRDRPFRFLDLPAELRLMVYERLPIKTTHHKLDYDNLTLAQLRNGEEDSVTFVHEAVSGSSILFVCRLIFSEARSILHSKAQALRLRPIKIITGPDVIKTDDFHSHLACLSHSACPVNSDIPHFLHESHREHRNIYFHYTSHSNSPSSSPANDPHASRKIEIAILINNKQSLANYTPVSHRMWDARVGYTILGIKFRDNFMGLLRMVSTQDVHVTCHMARMSAKERVQFDHHRPFIGSTRFRTSAVDVSLGFGEDIDEEEWEKDWAAGSESLE